MVTYALDASAILRLLDGEAGGEEVRSILYKSTEGTAAVLVCALHWGEVACHLYRKRGGRVQEQVLARLIGLGMEIVHVSPERAVRAAILKADLKIPYVDAFGVELAESTPCAFVTADYDLKPAAKRAEILFLPRK